MTYQPSNSENSFLSSEFIPPESSEDLRLILRDKFKKLIEATNDKDIGQYDVVTIPNGQNWFKSNDPQVNYPGTRKVIDIGGLADQSGALATQSVAHGITTTQNTVFTRIYGTANDPGASTITQAIPLPYVDVDALVGGIELWVDATNVNLRYQANYSNFTTAYVVLEWIEAV